MIVFARRQSPDWGALARDFRAGMPIDPARYVPAHAIPNFPDNVVELVAAWNAIFKIDFFTVRAFIAQLSAANIAAIPNAMAFSYNDREGIAALATLTDVTLFFHDDDDLFSPAITLPALRGDVAVFPLIRIHSDLATFVSPAVASSFIWGRAQPFLYRYHTNNYALTTNLCRHTGTLAAMTDHVEAGLFADQSGLRDEHFPTPVSATIKTPASASMLHEIVTDPDRFRAGIIAFAQKFAAPETELPPGYAWLASPLARIAALFAGIGAGRAG
jgi:hypothetical protein